MTDSLRALLTETPGLRVASRLEPSETRLLPVLSSLEPLLPERGLARGTTAAVAGAGATSLALALATRASEDAWVAAVGMPSLGLAWAAELGLSLDRLVVVPEPGGQWLGVLAAVVDAFDVVVARPPKFHHRDARKLSGRVREQRSVLLTIGAWPEAELRLEGSSPRWHGIGSGHGHLAARTITITVSGRGAAARPREARVWLPDENGSVSLAAHAAVTPLRRAD
jgi:hypothetical protein